MAKAFNSYLTILMITLLISSICICPVCASTTTAIITSDKNQNQATFDDFHLKILKFVPNTEWSDGTL